MFSVSGASTSSAARLQTSPATSTQSRHGNPQVNTLLARHAQTGGDVPFLPWVVINGSVDDLRAVLADPALTGSGLNTPFGDPPETALEWSMRSAPEKAKLLANVTREGHSDMTPLPSETSPATSSAPGPLAIPSHKSAPMEEANRHRNSTIAQTSGELLARTRGQMPLIGEPEGQTSLGAASDPEFEKSLEAASDPEFEKSLEAASDPELEKSLEAASDPELEKSLEAASDPELEKSLEAASDPELETSLEAASDSEFETSLEAASDPESEKSLEAASDPKFETNY